MKFTTHTTTKEVAAWSLRELNVSTPYVLDFEANDSIYLFGIDDGSPQRIAPSSELMDKIREIEASRDVKIYAVTHECLPIIGETYSFLCISPYKEDWECMVQYIGHNSFYVYAYVHNVAKPEYSESGFVTLLSNGRNLLRVG